MSEDTNSWEQQTINRMLESTIKEQRASRRWGVFFKLCTIGYLVIVTYLIVMQSKPLMQGMKHEKFTAVVDIKGILAPDKPASAKNIIPVLREAFADKNAKAVMLRINSPGGSPVQSQQIYTELQRLRGLHKDKKVYAVIEESGASGAYWLACGADEIYADQTSIVGSIGVILSSFGFVDTMQKLGVERRVYVAGDNKDMLDPFSPRNPAQDAMLNQDLQQVHQLFIDLVKTSRGERLKISEDMFSGRFWLGLDAKDLGLIDGFGDPYTVARDVIKAPELVEFNAKQSLFSQLGDKFGQSLENLVYDYKLA
jgi:protease IV